MTPEEFEKAVALADRLMEHVCGWPDHGEVLAVAQIIVQHPEVLDVGEQE